MLKAEREYILLYICGYILFFGAVSLILFEIDIIDDINLFKGIISIICIILIVISNRYFFTCGKWMKNGIEKYKISFINTIIFSFTILVYILSIDNIIINIQNYPDFSNNLFVFLIICIIIIPLGLIGSINNYRNIKLMKKHIEEVKNSTDTISNEVQKWLLFEKLFIISMNRKTKRQYLGIMNDRRAFAIAILYDLFLKRKIRIENHLIKIQDITSTNNPILDNILKYIKDLNNKRVVNVIFHLYLKSRDYSIDFYNQLNKQGIINFKEKKILKKSLFLWVDFLLSEVQIEIIRPVQRIIYNDEIPDCDSFSLFKIIEEIELVNRFIAKKFRQLFPKKLRDLGRKYLFNRKEYNFLLDLINYKDICFAMDFTAIDFC